jgi:hypothetical protein
MFWWDKEEKFLIFGGMGWDKEEKFLFCFWVVKKFYLIS